MTIREKEHKIVFFDRLRLVAGRKELSPFVEPLRINERRCALLF